jgi:Two component regulator propeller
MIPARVRAGVPNCPVLRLMLIVLVAACGGRGAAAQTAPPAGHRPIQHARVDDSPPRDLRFRRLTTNDGLSQNNVVAIVQDRHGFMWLGTAEGLNRYDGNSFVVRERPE